MAPPPSILDRVSRVQLVAAASVAALSVLAGGVAGTLRALEREDESGLATARLVAAEIARAPDARRVEEEVRDEASEQLPLGYTVEVWSGRRRIGGSVAGALVGPLDVAPGTCTSHTLRGTRWRVCGLEARGGRRVLVASPTAPVVTTVVELMASIGLASLVVVAVFAALSRRIVARTLAPLSALGARIGTLRPARAGERLGTSWGLHEVDELATRFDDLLGRIDEALGRERRFLFDASHELRTPLTRLRAHVELAREAPDGERQGHLAAASAVCTTLVERAEALLALARSELPAGQTVNLADLVRAQRADLEERAPADAARVVIEAPDEALVRADPALLGLAIANLVDNALKFSEGVVQITVTGGGDVTLAVQDAGPGIPEAERERVFESFYRGADAPRRASGSGLGLPLVRHVLRAYGGAVSLEAPPSGGLRVVVQLPRWTPS